VLTVQLAETCSEVIAFLEYPFAAPLDVGVEFGGEFAHAPAQVVEVEVDGRQLGEWAVAVGEGGWCILMRLRRAEVGLGCAEAGCGGGGGHVGVGVDYETSDSEVAK